MKSKPTLIRLIKLHSNKYDNRLPELKLEITINLYYYTKMSNNPDKFIYFFLN